MTTTAVALALTLPLPTRLLSPNGSGHVHWSRHRKAAAAYRELCAWVALEQTGLADTSLLRLPLRCASVRYTFVYCGPAKRSLQCAPVRHARDCACEYRPADCDNALAAIKAQQDALVDAHVLMADDAAHLALAGVLIQRHPRGCECAGGGRVEVELCEVLA